MLNRFLSFNLSIYMYYFSNNAYIHFCKFGGGVKPSSSAGFGIYQARVKVANLIYKIYSCLSRGSIYD